MRTFSAIVLGYVVTALLVYGGLAIAWKAMGPDRALQPGLWEASQEWIVASLVLGLFAAIAGGLTAASVGRNVTAPRLLALVIFVLGVSMAVAGLGETGTPEPRLDGPVSMTAAMQQTRTPSWVAFATAFLGAAGVLIGARRRLAHEELREASREVSP